MDAAIVGDPVSLTGRQVIPRPSTSEAGGPPPWEHLGEEHRRRIGLDRVLASLADGPAGREPAFEVPEAVRDYFRDTETVVRPAAVLVALFEEGGESRIVLTRRAAHLRAHRGEVAFPGGRIDEGETAVDAALREACEEVGLEPGAVTVVGRLRPLVTVSSRAVLHPVIGTLPGRPALEANPSEVEVVFDVPLARLLEPRTFREERWSIPRLAETPSDPLGSFPVWFFELGHDTVWGATARVLMDLLCGVLGLPAP